MMEVKSKLSKESKKDLMAVNLVREGNFYNNCVKY